MVVGIQQNPITLVHKAGVIADTKYRLSPPYRLAILILLRLILSPDEELIRTLVAIRAPVLMGLEERCLPMWEPICWVGMYYHSQRYPELGFC